MIKSVLINKLADTVVNRKFDSLNEAELFVLKTMLEQTVYEFKMDIDVEFDNDETHGAVIFYYHNDESLLEALIREVTGIVYSCLSDMRGYWMDCDPNCIEIYTGDDLETLDDEETLYTAQWYSRFLCLLQNELQMTATTDLPNQQVSHTMTSNGQENKKIEFLLHGLPGKPIDIVDHDNIRSLLAPVPDPSTGSRREVGRIADNCCSNHH